MSTRIVAAVCTCLLAAGCGGSGAVVVGSGQKPQPPAIDSVATMYAYAAPNSGRNGLEAVAARYLSKDHRDGRSKGCPFASLGSELARADEETRAVATKGLLKVVDTLARHFMGMRPDVAKRQALVALSTMVGALTLSRMMTQTELSDLLLQDAAEHVSAR